MGFKKILIAFDRCHINAFGHIKTVLKCFCTVSSAFVTRKRVVNNTVVVFHSVHPYFCLESFFFFASASLCIIKDMIPQITEETLSPNAMPRIV